ncbi:CCA tRNA nucleotidyltransferase [Halobaculum sp. CBA1158]|uniref:CCA tRNA nucleotidyltransferase n=1 Tax=Halobaculum sp. CBA1158 TaxID=2904243 RepID=UPI001F0BE11B|nr:CCA tRNA nucleotidyltransferase [Halobaculum sp. CBA1158]UIP00704.1 CCA tRNA nucleotidyltransferase [Halobaculum sp. CBA1158]
MTDPDDRSAGGDDGTDGDAGDLTDAADAPVDDLGAVLSTVRERVTPDADERERLSAAAADLAERARDAVADLPSPADEADVLTVGSTARGTWLAGDRDIDLFVRFPTALSRTELERFGLRVGHAVLPDGEEEYAEHPYVVGNVDGFDVDLVPCYGVQAATEIRSAVDRTPFHNEYLRERLTEDLAGDVRVLKAFLKGVGVYGSDLRTRGFSGYLTELLVVEHGGARETLEAVADWHPPVRFDPEDHGTAEFDDPLVVVDPTDPERNVAAVLSGDNLARLQHHARDLLTDPRTDPFFPDPTEPITAEECREHVRRRDTAPVAVAFDAPDIVDDQLYPQLRRSLSGIERELDGRGFDVIRSATFATDRDSATDPVPDPATGDAPDGDGTDRAAGRRAVLLVELASRELPAIERHEGPPVHVRDHAAGFHGKYAGDPDAYGPFVADGRYVVERERPPDERDAVAVLESDRIFEAALGARVESALETGYDVLARESLADLTDRFGADLREYFEPSV